MTHQFTRKQVDDFLINKGSTSKPPSKDGECMYIFHQYAPEGERCMKITRIKKNVYHLVYSNNLPPKVKKEIKQEIKKRSAKFREHLDKQTAKKGKRK